MNIQEALGFGERMLNDYGISDARWNAERILLLILQKQRADLIKDFKMELTLAQEESFRRTLAKRALHYPLAYIEGTQEFFGHEFYVNESVLIPRPETEEVIRAVLNLPLPSNPKILDIGSGSGAIAVTLARTIDGSKVTAIEQSKAAMSVLVRNAIQTIFIVRGDFYHLPFQNETFDLVVSNPPYVKLAEFDSLPQETRWEPREALVAKGDVYLDLMKGVAGILKPKGFFAFEIGFDQKEWVQDQIDRAAGFSVLDIRRDHQNIPRTFVLQKN